MSIVSGFITMRAVMASTNSFSQRTSGYSRAMPTAAANARPNAGCGQLPTIRAIVVMSVGTPPCATPTRFTSGA